MKEETTAEFYNNMSGYNKSPNLKNNKFDKKNTRDKSVIKFHRCEKFGHYANECRTSEHKIGTFRNPNNGQSQRPNLNVNILVNSVNTVETNHDISECRKLKRNEQNKTVVRNDQENHDRSISKIQSGSNVRIITPITQEHITYCSDKFVKNEITFLIDSGSEMNIIKISSLKGHIIMNEKDKKKIKGINASPVETVGSVVIPFYIDKQLFTIRYFVLDWDKEILIIPEKKEINNNALIIPPRSYCVLQIRADEQIDHEFITIEKYEINEDEIIANSICPVKGDKIISNIINISEQPFIIVQLTTSNLKWEPYNDCVFVANEEKYADNKIRKIKETIKTKHLNNEERDSIIDLCS
ncbi:CCHC-type domain-containing protein, partial [Aphis craccivora]